MTLRIYGAGMAGLLAANMLRRIGTPIVSEAQTELPDNHGALLRFRTDGVARETNQIFRRVRVLKAVKSGGRLRTASTIADANQYAYKVTGAVAPRSVLDLSACDRYVAPDNFINRMARDVVLKMGDPLTLNGLRALEGQRDIVAISTIPMPVLMKIVGWPEAVNFPHRPIWSASLDLGAGVDVFQTVYYPDPNVSHYRASITGRRLIIEWMEEPGCCVNDMDLDEILADFGMPDTISAARILPAITPIKRQEFGKLLPIPEEVRHEFILAMTDRYNLYSVGRFATWRQILLDDVVNDVNVVESMIMQRSAYTRRLSTVATMAHNGGTR